MEDYYNILGVEPTAKPEEIQERFRFLAQAFHPDKYSSARQKLLAEEEFKKINNAYQLLSNPRKRADYDLSRNRSASYSRASTTDTNKKAEEATRQRAWEEQKRKEEEEARQRVREEQKRKDVEEARRRAREEQKRKDEEAARQRVWEEQKRKDDETSQTTSAKIVSIYTPSDHEDKYNIAINLAAQVMLTGKRVGVVDTNLLSPSFNLFGLDEKKIGKTLNDFLHGKANIREVGLSVEGNTGEERAQLAGKNLFVFPASTNSRDISQILNVGIDFNLLNEGLQAAISEFNLDYLFIITRSILVEETLLTLAISDAVAISIKTENSDLQLTSAAIDILRNLDVPNLFLIVNEVLLKKSFIETKEEIEEKFQIPVFGTIPVLPEITDNRRSGIFSLNFPNHKWSKEIHKISNAILKIKNLTTAKPDNTANGVIFKKENFYPSAFGN